MLRQYMHCSTRDINRMSIHEGALHIERAVQAKDSLEMLIMQVNGIKVEEIEYYQKYFTNRSDDEPDEEEEVNHAEQVKNILAGFKKKHGK